MEDLRIISHELADSIQKCSVHYKFDLERTIAIGFSNGANIAVSIFFLRSELFQGAILFRAMVPFIPNSLPNLSNKRILLSAGLEDSIVPKTEKEILYKLFQKTNANTTLKWHPSSHNLIQENILVAKPWMLNNFPS